MSTFRERHRQRALQQESNAAFAVSPDARHGLIPLHGLNEGRMFDLDDDDDDDFSFFN